MAVLTAVIVSVAAVRVPVTRWMRLIMGGDRFAGVWVQMIMPGLCGTVGEELCRPVGMWVVVVKGVSHGMHRSALAG